jgi:hypothetical protein
VAWLVPDKQNVYSSSLIPADSISAPGALKCTKKP